VRSTLCRPSFSESASRSVASDTKPRFTSSLPTGWLVFSCSSSAIGSWSSVRMPCAIRIWPMWRLAAVTSWGDIRGEFISVLSLQQVMRARGGERAIESRGAPIGERKRAPVELDRLRLLVQMIEAHGEVERVIGVFGIGRERPEIRLLRLAPAALQRVLVAEREQQLRRIGLARE